MILGIKLVHCSSGSSGLWRVENYCSSQSRILLKHFSTDLGLSTSRPTACTYNTHNFKTNKFCGSRPIDRTDVHQFRMRKTRCDTFCRCLRDDTFVSIRTLVVLIFSFVRSRCQNKRPRTRRRIFARTTNHAVLNNDKKICTHIRIMLF